MGGAGTTSGAGGVFASWDGIRLVKEQPANGTLTVSCKFTEEGARLGRSQENLI